MASRYDTVLEVRSLAISRGSLPLIADLSFTVTSGQILWLTGPNGIGKTSLLLACAGLLTLDAGSIVWFSENTKMSARDVVSYAAHRGPERPPQTLGEELQFWQTLMNDHLSLEERLFSVGLTGRQATPVSGLSTGQKRRLGLARLLASDKAAWLMDEPLAGLDEEGRELTTNSLRQHLDQGGLAIIASHQPVVVPGVIAQKLVMRAPQTVDEG